MNVTNLKVQHKTSAVVAKGDSAKLLSLLALAAGAVAMPETSHADIVFVDLSANPIHVGPQASNSYVINSLPGTAQLGFHTRVTGTTRFVTGKQEGGYVRLKTNASFLAAVGPGANWVAGHTVVSGPVAGARGISYFPGGFSDRYLLFEFRDSTQPGSPLRFGWVEVSLANTNNPVAFPNLVIQGYAYDTTGAFLASGQVPEPSAPALLALGAMTLGAKGLRNWRKKRQTGAKA